MSRLKTGWQSLSAAFWFVPSAVTASYVGLAFLLIEVDRLSTLAFGFDGDASAARGILSTISGSLITVAGLSFSLTIVTLQLVSQQFTPRALRGLLADRVNQVVAGSFVGIFAYCLLVLRVIRSGGQEGDVPFVPGVAVSTAIVLALLSLFLLLVFIHHMGRSIQVSTIAARIGTELRSAIDRLYPDAYELAASAAPVGTSEAPAGVLRPARSGFVQRLDLAVLGAKAPEGAELHVLVAPGDFVTPATVLAEIRPAEAAHGLDVCVPSAVTVADERDLVQDTRFGIRQLVDIALRAISPGINDPTTAVMCIGYLQATLEQLAGRAMPAELREEGRALVIADRPDFGAHLRLAFLELGRLADVRVAAALLNALAATGAAARRAGALDRLDEVQAIATRVVEDVLDEGSSAADRAFLEHRLAAVG